MIACSSHIEMTHWLKITKTLEIHL